MSRVILLLLLLSCFGCVYIRGNEDTGEAVYVPIKEPGMRFALLEDNGWSIIAERRETWTKYFYGHNLPLQQYFPSKYVRRYTFPVDNFFYAIYPLGGGEELALMVNLSSCFVRSNAEKNAEKNAGKSKDSTMKMIVRALFLLDIHQPLPLPGDEKTGSNLQMTAIAMNTPHVSFAGDSVYLLIKQHTIVGTEISYGRAVALKDMPACERGVYDLASAETVATRQYREELEPRDIMPFPTFYFRFPVSCRGLEDAVFVIDGFTTRDGKHLPPLKVRLNSDDSALIRK